MDKAHIISEIKRIAAETGGKPPGRDLFERQTGIRMSDWYPHIWLRWGDAQVEAGFSPNKLTTAISDDFLYQKYIALTRELGHLPLDGERRRKARTDKSFPSHSTWQKLGDKEAFFRGLLLFCETHAGNEDIVALCLSRPQSKANRADPAILSPSADPNLGFVYLIKHGSRSEYKIGRTSNPIRREGEMRLQLPERIKPIHYIETDDPAGIEAYWHTRFASKRKEGEWFALTPDDVKAFKKWKRIS